MNTRLIIWEKKGNGWTMQLWHLGETDEFSISAQAESSRRGWLASMTREEAKVLAEKLTMTSEEILHGNE